MSRRADATKECTRCKAAKPVAGFQKHTYSKDGLRSECKACTAEYERQRRQRPDYKRWRAEYMRQYHRRPEIKVKMVQKEQNRRAPKREAGGILTVTAQDLAERQWGHCFWCRRPFTAERQPTLDHFDPLARGGLHDDSNVVAACLSCNARKNNRDPEEFASEMGLNFPVRLMLPTRQVPW